MPYAVFIVPQGREAEWLFSTREGRLQLADSTKGEFFSKVKLSVVLSTTFEFSRQKLGTKFLENGTFQSIRNLK